MMTITLRDVGYFATIILVTVVSCPFSIYCLLLLRKHWKSRCFEQRRPIIIASLLVLNQSTALVKIYIDFVGYWVYSPDHESIFDILGWSTYLPLTYFWFAFYNIRFWLLYYDGQVSHAIKNRSWRMAIDPNVESKNKYLDPNFQRIFGNDGRYLIIIAICASIIESIGTVFALMMAYWGIIVWGVLSVIHVAVACISWISFQRKLNNYDHFGIRKEIEVTIYTGLSFFATYLVTYMLITYVATEREYAWIENMEWFIFCTLLQYMAVPYVLKFQNNTTTIGSVKMKLAKSIQDVNDKHHRMSASSVVHSTSGTPRGNSDIDIDIDSNFDFEFKHWCQVVSSEYGYELFINHLEKEYSVENLLFLTEYVQLKTVLEYKFDILTQLIDNNEKEMGFDVEMPKISQSLLIKQDKHQQEKQEKQDLKQKQDLHIQVSEFELPISKIAVKLYHDKNVIVAFKSLYNKYIDGTNAPFMINISSRQRKSLLKLLDCRYYNKIILAQKGTAANDANSGKNESDSFKIALIDDQFMQNNESMEWLLKCVITEMDVAAKEIARVMNDSFLRFKNQIS